MASAKGHEYMLDDYLGTHSNKIADEVAKDHVTEILWREAPKREDGFSCGFEF